MAHLPHLYLPGPWEQPVLAPTAQQFHHLRRVLRRTDAEPISYTDGSGRVGTGTVTARGVQRGDEYTVARPVPSVTLAVAPPQSTERARFLVEKLAELGVDRLVWLSTRHTQGHPPRREKSLAWAGAALEQSRGAWLMTVEGPTAIGNLEGAVWVASPRSAPPPRVNGDTTLVVGPEGGLAPDEVGSEAVEIGLGDRILRVETAAIVGAALMLDRSGRNTT